MSKLVYVMTATRWQNINLVPLLNLPAPALIVIMVARRGGHFTDEDREKAHRSSLGFVQGWRLLARDRQQSEAPGLEMIVGPLEQPAFWKRALRVVLEEKAPQEGEVVYNYLGGSKQTTLGALGALDDLAAARPDLTLRRVAPGADDGMLRWLDMEWHEEEEQINGRISPDAWFACLSKREAEAAGRARLAGERAARRWADTTREVAQICLESTGLPWGWLVEVFGGLMGSRQETEHDLAQIARGASALRNSDPALLAEGLQEFANAINRMGANGGRFPGVRVEGTSLFTPAGSGLVQWLKGGWFEEYCYLILGNTLGFDRVMLNLSLEALAMDGELAAALDGTSAIEVDVAVFTDTQMHAIECKALVESARRKRMRQVVNQCLRTREELVGPGGTVTLCLPGSVAETSLTAEFAQRNGVKLACGPVAIRDLALDLRRRV